MIIARSPLRITFGGGGTDLPSYYERYGGFSIAGAINRHVYVAVTRPFVPGIFLKYSALEKVAQVDEIRHPIIREALRTLNLSSPQIEVTTWADIPAGTGLGSSGSFTTALMEALFVHHKRRLVSTELAAAACEIEIERLREPAGKQDQYIAAYGGIMCLTFCSNGEVEVCPLRLSPDTLFDLEDNLLLFFTGFERRSSQILQDQRQRSLNDDPAILDNLHQAKELGLRSRKALEAGQTNEFGKLLHEQWENKRNRGRDLTNSRIDQWYDLGRRNGAVGGKLVGAGGGGFLLFYAEDRKRLRQTMAHAGLEEVRFRFDFEGTRLVSVT